MKSFIYLHTKVYSKNETSMPSPTGLEEFLPFCFTKRVNSPKALPYSFFS